MADETPPASERRQSLETVCARAESQFGSAVTNAVELDGGKVGSVSRLDFADRDAVVAKVSDTPLTVEAEMLRYLDRESALPVPEVYHATTDCLLMEYVEGDGKFTEAVERDAADCLAELHEVTAEQSGFPFDTLSGPYSLPNPWTESWIDFFGEFRLLDVADAAAEAGTLPSADRERVAALTSDLDSLLTEPAAPALLHGDVWSENVVVRDGHVRAFLDPAMYYGHPEIELAYILAFDTFGDAFFERYDDRRGIEDGFFETRATVYTVFSSLELVRYFGCDKLSSLRDALTELGY
ncbi:fructosamine kinase family protein [Halogeometricum borinquense]|uniref:Fructosamine kinase family protein n=1 Tax=Halogeometricum borinquense TaxID=60847 RepID=A0A6C0UEN6_9EURY|nr:fructosamine kinase family protein [Halogeometricum borinquense]QIB73660.1 fructosamine kinase family protein [Halogeometricum borinquense]QIQ76984.1 fructosamine kinase family protein [Halogeometricum borinquense]